MSLIGAVDIGGTKTAIGAVDANGRVVYDTQFPTDATRGVTDFFQCIRLKIHEMVEACGAIDGIGICCPGPLDAFTGILGEVGTLPGWQGVNLVKEFEKDFRVRVAIENDADAAALAEHKWGSGKGTNSFIYVTVSTGIGGGIILGGQLYRGSRGAHPELGHQVIADSGPSCYCGARGCWESLASGSAMSEWMRHIDPDQSSYTAAEICEAARNGNAMALRVTARESYYLGLGLANIVTLFTPEMIALGGGVMKSSDLIFENALAVVKRLCTQVPTEGTEIVLSSVGANVGLLGAYEVWSRRYS